MATSAACSSSQSSSFALAKKLAWHVLERPLAAAYESTRIKLSVAESFGFNIVNVSFSSSSENHGRNDGPPVLSGDMAMPDPLTAPAPPRPEWRQIPSVVKRPERCLRRADHHRRRPGGSVEGAVRSSEKCDAATCASRSGGWRLSHISRWSGADA